MARRITIEQLAAMVAGGFEDVRQEMTGLRGEIREGFDSLRAVQTDHSHRLDRIERKLDGVVGRVDDHDVRLQALEKKRSPRS